MSLQPPSIEIRKPDLARWQSGNVGIPYVWSFASGAPGPHCAIVALTHGNEYCGALALDRLLSQAVRPKRGTLSLVFANIDAFLAFDDEAPFESRCLDEDFNRLWDEVTLNGARTSRELMRARTLRPFVDTVDHLLDLHSMHETATPLLLAGTSRKGREQARAIAFPQHVIIDRGHAAGKRLFDYADFLNDTSSKTAYLVECGQHWEHNAETVAHESCARFLAHFGMIDAPPLPSPATQKFIEVTDVIDIHAPELFKWAQPWGNMEVVPTRGTLLATEGSRRILSTHDQCVMIMPTRDPKSGTTAVRLGRVVD